MNDFTATEFENDGRRWFHVTGPHFGDRNGMVTRDYGLCDDGTVVDSDGMPVEPSCCHVDRMVIAAVKHAAG